MPKKNTPAVLMRTTAEIRSLAGSAVQVDQVHHVRRLQPTRGGPWRREADKIAWLDPATGLHCIILRAEDGGHLCGYVGIEPGHPLFGFDHAALPDALDIIVHGGVSYSAACEDAPEETSVCHVVEHAERADFEHDDRWWFGFECNQSYDIVPDRLPSSNAGLGMEPEYRDECYVFTQCRSLAHQLRAIGEGRRPTDPVPPVPPIGLDPARAKG